MYQNVKELSVIFETRGIQNIISQISIAIFIEMS